MTLFRSAKRLELNKPIHNVAHLAYCGSSLTILISTACWYGFLFTLSLELELWYHILLFYRFPFFKQPVPRKQATAQVYR